MDLQRVPADPVGEGDRLILFHQDQAEFLRHRVIAEDVDHRIAVRVAGQLAEKRDACSGGEARMPVRTAEIFQNRQHIRVKLCAFLIAEVFVIRIPACDQQVKIVDPFRRVFQPHRDHWLGTHVGENRQRQGEGSKQENGKAEGELPYHEKASFFRDYRFPYSSLRRKPATTTPSSAKPSALG